jgi:SAM-dependent methyltransferase
MTVAGSVELLSSKKIVGWALDSESSRPAIVDICLDDTPIRKLRAERARPGFEQFPCGGRVGFRFRIGRSLLPYIATKESLSFRLNGHTLPVVSNRLQLPKAGNRKPTAELLNLLQRGYIVTKKGEVKLSIHLDTNWQRRILTFYERARREFADSFGYDLYIVYGTLLGYARENDFIAGDDDFDVAYLSRHEDPIKVKREFIDIVKTLNALGKNIRIGKRRNLFHWKNDDGLVIDIFPSWLNKDNYYLTFAVGAPCAAAVRQGFRTERFYDHDVIVPVAKERVLEGIYGPNWRTPDPYFQWTLTSSVRKSMRKVRLSEVELAEVYWDRIYRRADRLTEPSSFAKFAQQWITAETRAVIDIGCGNGRDTHYVAGGRPVLGIDYSSGVIEQNKSRWPKSKFPKVEFAQADVKDLDTMLTATRDLIESAGGAVAAYSRFFLHAIDDEAEEDLRKFLEQVLPSGSLVLLEFRTHLDRSLSRVHEDHFRRFIDPDALISRFARTGRFRLMSRESGQGLAPYKDEDPHVARLVFRVD